MSFRGHEEIESLTVDLVNASAQVTRLAGRAVEKTLGDIQAGAQERAPVDTGALKNSISRSMAARGTVVHGEVGPTVNYAAFVERGTSRMRAQPYLRPATDAALPGFEAAIEQLGGDLIGGTG